MTKTTIIQIVCAVLVAAFIITVLFFAGGESVQ